MLWPDGDVFKGFWEFSDWVYTQTKATWKIAQERMAHLLFDYLTSVKNADRDAAGRAMASDFSKAHGKRLPPFLREFAAEKESHEQTFTGNASTKRQTLRA